MIHRLDWVRRDEARLRHYLSNLDASSSPTPLSDLSDIRVCELSLASAYLSQLQTNIVLPAKRFWLSRTPGLTKLGMYMQRTLFSLQRLDLELLIQTCSDQETNLYLLIFRIEEVMCELRRRAFEGLVVNRIRENSTHETLELLKTAKVVLEKAFAFKLSDSQACAAVRTEIETILDALRHPPGSLAWYLAGMDLVNPCREVIPLVHHAPLRMAGLGVASLVVGALTLHYIPSVQAARSAVEALQSKVDSAKSFVWDEHLQQPLRVVVDEVFGGRRGGDKLNRQSAEDARASLERMVRSFNEDTGLPSGEGIDVSSISRAYERAIVNPLREALGGDLVRLALIQGQQVKAETLALANQLDVVMAENRFMTQVLSMVPAFGLLYGARVLVVRLFRLLFDQTPSESAARRGLTRTLDEVERLLVVEEDGPSLIATYSLDEFESEDDSYSESENIRLLGDPVLRRRRLESGRFVCKVHLLGAMLQGSTVAAVVGDDELLSQARNDCLSLLHRQGLSPTARRAILALLRRELGC